MYPQRVRSLTLTDCDVHDNWPPAAFKPFLAMAAGGGLRGTLEAMLSSKDIYRSPQALDLHTSTRNKSPTRASKPTCGRLSRSDRAVRARPPTFSGGLRQRAYSRHRARLKTLTVLTLIVWGTDDVYFDVEWSKWLAETIPGTRRRLEFEGARIFFPEERWIDFNKALREHW